MPIIQCIHEIDSSSSPVISKIPIKIKNSLNLFLPLLNNLFNTCIINKQVPDEWIFLIVKPLFKGKGSEMDINNYCGISILPPCKAFRKINCSPDRRILLKHLFLFDSQHGYRTHNSCETALHQFTSDSNTALLLNKFNQ